LAPWRMAINPREAALERYRAATAVATREGELDLLYRELAKSDLFFLLVFILGVKPADNDWVFARCREFQRAPDGFLDLWAREHWKSTIITFAAVIQAILIDPNVTVAIFSFNRPIAKAFLRVIKTQFESNERLKELFPEIFYAEPSKEASKWSEDDGICVKRTEILKEMTVEAWGLVDGQPTSKHFKLCVYDDVVVRESVTSPEMINKTTEAVSVSFNLTSENGGRRWMIGTFYHYADTYSVLIRRGAVKPRIYPATEDGTFAGTPVLWSKERLAQKVKEMGSYVSSCQLFLKPMMEGEEVFLEKDLKYWLPRDSRSYGMMNRYILVDPASSKKKDSDYTVMMVYGLGADRNYYVIDMVRDRLSLSERSRRLFSLHALYKPIAVGYEKYGMQADIEHIKDLMERQQYRFHIIELSGQMPKLDRIKRLQPITQEGRFYLPETLNRIDYQHVTRDLTQDFIQDEYLQFPYMTHDDMLDCASRIVDPDLAAFFPNNRKGDMEVYADEDGHDSYEYDTYAYLSLR
jgi:predicted phage terminase large subunit-like protein